MFHHLSRLLVVVALAAWAPSTVAADVRTWTDSSGKFTIKAKFVSVADGKVTLEQEDGATVEIDLANLSPADQKYVADQRAAAENPFKKKEQNPFKQNASRGSAPVGQEPPLAPVDWSSAKMVDVNPTSAQWKLPTAAGPSEEAKPRTIQLPPKGNFFEKTKGIVLNLASHQAIVGYGLDDPRPTGVTRLAVVDLAASRLLTTVKMPGLFAPIALADDGQRIVMRRDVFGHGNQDRLEVWRIDGAGAKKLLRWIPYGDVHGADHDVRWAEFLADGRLATCSAGGRLAVWELDPLKPVLQLHIKNGCIPAVSPDRKYIAFVTEKEVGVFDPTAGQVVVAHDAPATQWPTLAVSPNGKRLACAGFDRLFVWDWATGDLQREIPYQGVHVGGLIAWAGDDHVLVGGRTLLDLERQIRLWEYPGSEATAAAGGLVWFVASDGERGPGALIAAKLPQEQVLNRLTKAMAEPDFFVLKPGTTVRVDTSGLADADRREKIAGALATKLEANGCKVGDDGSIVLKAATVVGKEREVTYHTFGVPFGNKTYKVREHSSQVQFVYQGKVAWQSAAGNIPFFVRLAEDETMEQYLKKHEKPNYDWFEKVELPKLLTKPTGATPGLGMSRVTTGGLR